MTGPPFSPCKATELVDIKREEEGRAKHPDLYPPKPSAAAAAAAAAAGAAAAGVGVSGCSCCCVYCGFCPREEAAAAVAAAAAAATATAKQRRCYCELSLKQFCVLGDPEEAANKTRERLGFIQPFLTVDGEV